MDFDIQIYATDHGKEPFNEWIKSLKNIDAKAHVFQRLQRIRIGNFGDCKPIAGGLWELRIHSYTGLRIYYARVGARLILLVAGGDKGSQSRDIIQAKKYLEDYKKRIL